MLIVVALGGNALLQRGQSPDAEAQEANVRAAAQSIAKLARVHDVVLTHGNGPQVGMLAAESELDTALSHPFPLDALGAATEGLVGYWLQRELANALPGRAVITVLTQTVVDTADPAFRDPQKYIGQVYEKDIAHKISVERGWTVKPDGRYWRRVVPSPTPLEIVELPAIRALLAGGTIVICAGGGGIPVARTAAGLEGVEAVIDKDRAAGLLAKQLDADGLLLLTDVEAVQTDFGSPAARTLGTVTSDELRSMSFPAGSMGPKVDAACRFVEGGGAFAAIGSLTRALELTTGEAGTMVVEHVAAERVG